MIEIHASGPVRTYENSRVDWMDGIDPIRGRVITSEETEVSITLELPQGHVNLEGFAPSRLDWPMRDIVGQYVRDTVDGDFEIVDTEWDVEIQGNYWDWIQQAHRYMTERPNRSLIEILELFLGWEETSDNPLKEAILQVDDQTELSHVALGDLSDVHWNELRQQLNQIYEVEIPESYRNDDEDNKNEHGTETAASIAD